MVDFSHFINNENSEIVLTHEEFSNMIDYTSFSTGNMLVDEDVKSIIEQSFLYLVRHNKEAEELAFNNDTWQIKIGYKFIKVPNTPRVLS